MDQLKHEVKNKVHGTVPVRAKEYLCESKTKPTDSRSAVKSILSRAFGVASPEDLEVIRVKSFSLSLTLFVGTAINAVFILCRRRDLNSHVLRRSILSRLRIPFRHSGSRHTLPQNQIFLNICEFGLCPLQCEYVTIFWRFYILD
ncbi:MAG: hypothetical protein RLY57_707 [Candidatus Parcubacteria bacterium]